MASDAQLEALNYSEKALLPPRQLYQDGLDDSSSTSSIDDALERDEEKGLLSPAAASPLATSTAPRSTIVVLLVTIAALAAFGAGHSQVRRNAYRGHGSRPITLDHIFNGTFAIDYGPSIDWLAEAGDGVYAERTSANDIVLHDLAGNETRTLVQGSEVRDRNGEKLRWRDFSLSADAQFILFSSRWTKRWRHSSRSDFYLHSIDSRTTSSLIAFTDPPTTALARWSPHGHTLAYIDDANLFLITSPNDEPVQITTSRNLTIPWVYEEEILSSDSALWWSPDGLRIAFLSFDETRVPLFEFPLYNPDNQGAQPYPAKMTIPYPKPGREYENPTAAAHVYDLETGHLIHLDLDMAFAPLDRLVHEAAWVTATDLVVKLTDRLGKHLKVVHYDMLTTRGRVVRDVDYAALDGGWYEPGVTMIPLPGLAPSGIDTQNVPTGYLDVLPDAKGFRHIALFSPVDASMPTFLTSGEWEVAGTIERVDLHRKLIYFMAAEPATDRRLRSIPLPSRSDLKPALPTGYMTDSGYHSVSFSPQGGFYALLRAGPGLPSSQVFRAQGGSPLISLSSNSALNNSLNTYLMPQTRLKQIVVGDQTFNVQEILPPRFSSSSKTRHPLLVRCYGGPNSQLVTSRFETSWHTYLASVLGYIILTIDNRGTGFRGRGFRAPVAGRLGQLEAEDQIAVAAAYANQSFVDETRVGIWGWSYGGFLTTKVIESASRVFSLGMAVAPVTDWRYYDSVYTERYMGDPATNAEGYARSAIRNMTGFHNASFFLAHGSGDDNVHYLNSANLLDRFTQARVRDFRFRMFTDSDHSITTRGANREVYEEMTRFLIEHWSGDKSHRSVYDRRT